jgi:hypothetical protein
LQREIHAALTTINRGQVYTRTAQLRGLIIGAGLALSIDGQEDAADLIRFLLQWANGLLDVTETRTIVNDGPTTSRPHGLARFHGGTLAQPIRPPVLEVPYGVAFATFLGAWQSHVEHYPDATRYVRNDGERRCVRDERIDHGFAAPPRVLTVVVNVSDANRPHAQPANHAQMPQTFTLGATRYRQVSVVHHHGGSLKGGHYTASRRENEGWYHANDATVSYGRGAGVPYLYTYERVEDDADVEHDEELAPLPRPAKNFDPPQPRKHRTLIAKGREESQVSIGGRVMELISLLHRREQKVKPVAAALVGGNIAELDRQFSAKDGRSLRAAIKSAFYMDADVFYLHSMLDHDGLPSLEARLLLAAGHVSLLGAQADGRAMIRLLEEADPAELAALRGGSWWETVAGELWLRSQSYARYARAIVDAAEASKDNAVSPEAQAAHLAELVALCDRLMGESKVKSKSKSLTRTKAIRRILEWAQRQNQTVRAYCGERIQQVLIDKGIEEFRAKYIKRIVRLDPGVGDGQVAEAIHYMRRKQRSGALLKSHRDSYWTTLVEKIEALSHGQRLELLRTKLKLAQVPADPTERAGAVEKFMAKLEKYGVGSDLRERIALAFAHGAPEGVMDKHATRVTLEREMHKWDGTPTSLLRGFAQRNKHEHIVKTIDGLSSQEYHVIRSDKVLLRELRSTLRALHHGEAWIWIRDLLCLTETEIDREGPMPGPTDDAEARAYDANRVELDPKHWTQRLGYALRDLTDVDRTKVVSITRRAQQAARRRRAVSEHGRGPTIPSLEPMTVEQFMSAVWEGLDKADRWFLRCDAQLEPVLRALQCGEPLQSLDSIDDAGFRGITKIKRVLGRKYKKEEVKAAVEETTGTDLVEQWSNIEELRELRKRLVHAIDANEQERLSGEIEGFVLDVREDVFEKLRSGLPAAQFLEVYEVIQNKLADAMTSDPEVRALLEIEGAKCDGLSAEMMRGLGALGGSRRDRSGAQIGAFSTKSRQREEARRQLLHELRGAEVDHDEERVAKLVHAREQLAARRTEFAVMKAKVRKWVVFSVGMVMSAVSTIATMGLAGPLVGAVGAMAALWLQSLLATGITVIVQEGVKLAFDGSNYDVYEGVYAMVKGLVLSAATVSAGLTSAPMLDAFGFPEHIAKELGLFDTFICALRDHVTAVSTVEVVYRALAEAALDKTVRYENEEQFKLEALKILRGIIWDVVRKSTNAVFGEAAGVDDATQTVGDGPTKKSEIQKLAVDQIMIKLAGEWLTSQNEGVFEATALSDKLMEGVNAEMDKLLEAKPLATGAREQSTALDLPSLVKSGADLAELRKRGYSWAEIRTVVPLSHIWAQYGVAVPYRSMHVYARELAGLGATWQELVVIGYDDEELSRCGLPEPQEPSIAEKEEMRRDMERLRGLEEEADLERRLERLRQHERVLLQAAESVEPRKKKEKQAEHST